MPVELELEVPDAVEAVVVRVEDEEEDEVVEPVKVKRCVSRVLVGMYEVASCLREKTKD